MTDAERIKQLEAENRILIGALKLIRPIVKEAFYDHHTAGIMPGAGYNHRVYSEVSKVFGWRDTDKFDAWDGLFDNLERADSDL